MQSNLWCGRIWNKNINLGTMARLKVDLGKCYRDTQHIGLMFIRHSSPDCLCTIELWIWICVHGSGCGLSKRETPSERLRQITKNHDCNCSAPPSLGFKRTFFRMLSYILRHSHPCTIPITSWSHHFTRSWRGFKLNFRFSKFRFFTFFSLSLPDIEKLSSNFVVAHDWQLVYLWQSNSLRAFSFPCGLERGRDFLGWVKQLLLAIPVEAI